MGRPRVLMLGGCFNMCNPDPDVLKFYDGVSTAIYIVLSVAVLIVIRWVFG